MLSRYIKRFLRLVRSFLLMLINKEFLIFLFFLVLSGSFWLIITLNETYEYELALPVTVKDVPRNVVITSMNTDTVRFTVRDKGYMIAAYLYGKDFSPIALEYSNSVTSEGNGAMGQAELTRAITNQLYKSTKLIQVKPSAITFTFNYGQHKRVPVKMLGTVLTADSYYLSHVQFSPDHVYVYGTNTVLDSIRFVYTDRLNMTNVTDTVRLRVKLQPIHGVKITPSVVTITLYPDVLTEESVEVPITPVNLPGDKMLRTFPSRVKVSFVIGSGLVRRLRNHMKPSDFSVEADYNDVVAHPSDKCHITLKKYPEYVRNPRLETTDVDYLIEQ